PTPQNNRLYPLFKALGDLDVQAEPAPYADEFAREIHERLLAFDSVLVWVDPITDGKDRSTLDPMLRDLSQRGVWVSAHPEVIQKIGTKEVLFRTKHFGWGTDTRLYNTAQELAAGFPETLRSAGPRVLKQRRGNGGIGTWKVEIANPSMADRDPLVRIHEARRGSEQVEVPLSHFMERCEKYLSGLGWLVDQPLQPPP